MLPSVRRAIKKNDIVALTNFLDNGLDLTGNDWEVISEAIQYSDKETKQLLFAAITPDDVSKLGNVSRDFIEILVVKNEIGFVTAVLNKGFSSELQIPFIARSRLVILMVKYGRLAMLITWYKFDPSILSELERYAHQLVCINSKLSDELVEEAQDLPFKVVLPFYKAWIKQSGIINLISLTTAESHRTGLLTMMK